MNLLLRMLLLAALVLAHGNHGGSSHEDDLDTYDPNPPPLNPPVPTPPFNGDLCDSPVAQAVVGIAQECGDQAYEIGQACWDANNNGQCDLPEEDRNNDQQCTAADCQGDDGAPGLNCWDVNQNGFCDPAEAAADGQPGCGPGDCRGTDGTDGQQGPPGPRGFPGDAGQPGTFTYAQCPGAAFENNWVVIYNSTGNCFYGAANEPFELGPALVICPGAVFEEDWILVKNTSADCFYGAPKPQAPSCLPSCGGVLVSGAPLYLNESGDCYRTGADFEGIPWCGGMEPPAGEYVLLWEGSCINYTLASAFVVSPNPCPPSETFCGGACIAFNTPCGTDVGVCSAGILGCVNDQQVCVGNIGPQEPGGESLCSDGLDNDCNGLTDCEEPACSGALNCI